MQSPKQRLLPRRGFFEQIRPQRKAQLSCQRSMPTRLEEKQTWWTKVKYFQLQFKKG